MSRPFPWITAAHKSLDVWTTVGDDGSRDHFSSPKQIRWSVALGKLLVANGVTTVNFYQRNADLSYHSKLYYIASAMSIIDSDAANIYTSAGSGIRKWPLSFNYSGSAVYLSFELIGLKMIDASSDPLYIYATRNLADHHEVVKILKSDMTIVAIVGGAAGSGNGAFNNPLGVLYYNGYVYVADLTNNRIVKLLSSGADLTFDSNITLTITAPEDLCFDGTNWFVQIAATLYKYDAAFTDASKISVATNGYSVTIIPDQGDGYGQTIAVCSNTNSNLKRHRCSDLSLINTVGTSGTGAASLFDPVITGPAGVWRMDTGETFNVASGANISWNGFSGWTPPTTGPHKCSYYPVGGLKTITGINCNTDSIIKISNIRKVSNNQSLIAYSNVGLGLNLDFVNMNSRDVQLYSLTWSASNVDAILLSISDAIHTNVNNFSYATPSLQIGGTNAAPGGTASAATTSPLVTPGSGNSNSDWMWDAGAGKHKALTGMAAIWIARNNTGHVWTITATGVT